MKSIRFAMIMGMLGTPIYMQPAHAQTTEQWEEMDAEFLACKERFIRDGFGDDNLATQWCYERVYGSEQSGGGDPDPLPLPGDPPVCKDNFGPACAPNERPN